MNLDEAPIIRNHADDRGVTFVGFDSAWTDNPRAPGAVCAVSLSGGHQRRFYAPQFASFGGALEFVRSVRAADGLTIVAIDQPTLVPNPAGMRPVERVAASLVSWLGGGVQPANRGRTGMFDDAAPIWRFLTELGGTEDPEKARIAADGLFVMEVFPALALASIDNMFCGRLSGPRYNPGRRKTFRIDDWRRVANSVALEARSLGCDGLAQWCEEASACLQPKKGNQDLLDSAICLLTAVRWRMRPREQSIMLGDLSTGYMVAPASEAVRERLSAAAERCGVPIDEFYSASVACPAQGG